MSLLIGIVQVQVHDDITLHCSIILHYFSLVGLPCIFFKSLSQDPAKWSHQNECVRKLCFLYIVLLSVSTWPKAKSGTLG